MSNLVEPRGVAYDHDGTDEAGHDVPARAGHEGELASLVRRWMAGNRGLERNRRDSLLRVAPAPAPESHAEPDAAEERVEEVEEVEEVEVQVVDPAEHPTDDLVEDLAESPAENPAADPAEDLAEDLIEPSLRAPALPHRPTAEETEHATRLAVLIDARRVSEDVASGLLTRLGDRGLVNVCRAYADWSRADLGDWVERLRRQGLHSFHQFDDGDDQALVAMAIDAVDIAREAAVDEVVVAGDLTSMLPLVHRLHSAGVRVVAVGPAHTPHDVRGAVDEFLLDESLVGERVVLAGRHRA